MRVPVACCSGAKFRYEGQLADKQRRIDRLTEKLSSRAISTKQLSSIFKNKERKIREETSALLSQPTEESNAEDATTPRDTPAVDAKEDTPAEIDVTPTVDVVSSVAAPPPTPPRIHTDASSASADVLRRHSSPVLSLTKPLSSISTKPEVGGLSTPLVDALVLGSDWKKAPGTRLWMWGSLSRAQPSLPPSASALGLGGLSSNSVAYSRAHHVLSQAQSRRFADADLVIPSLPESPSTLDVPTPRTSGSLLVTTPQVLPVLLRTRLQCISACDERVMFLSKSGDVFIWTAVIPDDRSKLKSPSSVSDSSSVRVWVWMGVWVLAKSATQRFAACPQNGMTTSDKEEFANFATKPPRLVQFFSIERSLFGARVVKVSCGGAHQVALTGEAVCGDGSWRFVRVTVLWLLSQMRDTCTLGGTVKMAGWGTIAPSQRASRVWCSRCWTTRWRTSLQVVHTLRR